VNQVELLIVEDTFDITGHGLIVVPAFDMGGHWENREEPVSVLRPDGTSISTQAKLQRTHFRIFDRAHSGSPWKVVVTLPAESKASVPIGSRIWGSEALRTALLAA